MAIVLAAGGSRRFGRGDKLLARIGRATMLERAIGCARAFTRGRVLVVVPARFGRAAAIAGLVRPAPVRVLARRHRSGMGASLRAGLAAVRPIEREVAIFLGDMPFATAPRRLRLRPGDDAARPMLEGRPGHPLLVRASAARRALPSIADAGLGGTLGRVRPVPGSPGNLLDVDTRAALRRARLGGVRRRPC